jgi:hypothetical protein
MERLPVSSTTIKSVGYDPDGLLLEVQFRPSGIYRYSRVPVERYLNLMNASSKGRYFNRYIKGKYPFKKV